MGPAWLPQAEAWCHRLGVLKAWARVPVGLWVGAVRKARVQIKAPPPPDRPTELVFLTLLGLSLLSCAVRGNHSVPWRMWGG